MVWGGWITTMWFSYLFFRLFQNSRPNATSSKSLVLDSKTQLFTHFSDSHVSQRMWKSLLRGFRMIAPSTVTGGIYWCFSLFASKSMQMHAKSEKINKPHQLLLKAAQSCGNRVQETFTSFEKHDCRWNVWKFVFWSPKVAIWRMQHLVLNSGKVWKTNMKIT